MTKAPSATIGSHYNPKFILENFTDPDGWVHCYRVQGGKRYRQRPEDAGKEKNLYRITHSGVADPQTLEQRFADAESRMAPTIETIIKTGRLTGAPEEEAVLAAFVAGSAFRVPHAKRLSEYLADTMARQVVVGLFEAPDQWRRFQEYCRNRGMQVPADADQPRYVEMARRGDVQLRKYEGWIWDFLTTVAMPVALRILVDFSWRLWSRPDSAKACVVTSDNPVGLLRVGDLGQGTRGSILLESGVIGNWRLATQISLPLSRARVLIGNRRGSPELERVADEVAWLNTVSCWFASTVFAPCETPRFQLPDGQVTGISHFASKLEQFRRYAPPARCEICS